METFYRENDIILTPMINAPCWSMFNEIRDEFDYDLYAVSIIQESKERSAEEWYRYGRLLYREVSKKLLTHKKNPSMEEVLYWCNVAEYDKVKDLLKARPQNLYSLKVQKELQGVPDLF
ncbi:type IV secretion system DNA-binding domain-containing protein [Enterobacter cloacae]|uniref:type IV secretion system DNA-binding domain-containing protein n=1 Tax=Enterobacter cloacae TaxID=550 RepID=UPI00388FF425